MNEEHTPDPTLQAITDDLRRWYEDELVPEHGPEAARSILRDEVLYRPDGDEALYTREALMDLIGPADLVDRLIDERRRYWDELQKRQDADFPPN